MKMKKYALIILFALCNSLVFTMEMETSSNDDPMYVDEEMQVYYPEGDVVEFNLKLAMVLGKYGFTFTSLQDSFNSLALIITNLAFEKNTLQAERVRLNKTILKLREQKQTGQSFAPVRPVKIEKVDLQAILDQYGFVITNDDYFDIKNLLYIIASIEKNIENLNSDIDYSKRSIAHLEYQIKTGQDLPPLKRR